MDLKRNERFYKQTDLWRLVGGGLLIVGFIWLWIGRSMLSYYLPVVMIPVGLVMFLVASARNVPESEIRGNIQKTMQDLGCDISERREVSATVLRTPAPYRGEAFVFDGRMKAARRGKDSKLLSDVYCATAIFFTKEALLLRGRVLDLSDGTVEGTEKKWLWESIASATVVPFEYRVTITNKRRQTATARGVELVLVSREGEELYRAPVPNDMDSEELCQHIEKMAAAANA